jgi:hypothetical protein
VAHNNIQTEQFPSLTEFFPCCRQTYQGYRYDSASCGTARSFAARNPSIRCDHWAKGSDLWRPSDGYRDNPATSGLCAHSWRSAEFVSSHIDAHQSAATRSLARTILDWMYDVLHGALLGYVKYLWKATIDDSEIKKDLEALALLQETNNYDFAAILSGLKDIQCNSPCNTYCSCQSVYPLTLRTSRCLG